MSFMLRAFTMGEATRLGGQRVKLTHPMPDRYLGETGQVTGRFEYLNGYALEVTWDIGYGDGAGRVDYFTADEFEEFVREV